MSAGLQVLVETDDGEAGRVHRGEVDAGRFSRHPLLVEEAVLGEVRVEELNFRLRARPVVEQRGTDPVEVVRLQADLAQKTPFLAPSYRPGLGRRVSAVADGVQVPERAHSGLRLDALNPGDARLRAGELLRLAALRTQRDPGFDGSFPGALARLRLQGEEMLPVGLHLVGDLRVGDRVRVLGVPANPFGSLLRPGLLRLGDLLVPGRPGVEQLPASTVMVKPRAIALLLAGGEVGTGLLGGPLGRFEIVLRLLTRSRARVSERSAALRRSSPTSSS